MQHGFAGDWQSFFIPFAIMIAITTLAVFMTHGAIYLAMRTENRLYTEVTILAKNFTIFFVVVFGLSTLYTLLMVAIEVFANLLFAINLRILLTIALIGAPLVAIYASFVFWTFNGKTRLDEMSY